MKKVSLIIQLLTMAHSFAYCQKNDFSKYSYRVSAEVGTDMIISGTGFILKIDSKYFLITANHVYTARDPVTGIRKPGVTHSAQVFRIFQKNPEGGGTDQKISLFNGDNPLAIEATKGQELLFDIVAFPIVDIKPFKNVIDVHTMDVDVSVGIGDSVMAYGYPEIPYNHGFSTFAQGEIIEFTQNKSHTKLKMKTGDGFSGSPAFVKKKRICP